jgi:hypothetical protein
VIFSKHSKTNREESKGSDGASVENFDQTVDLSIHHLYIISWFSHLLFKPADLQAESRA